MHKLLGLIRKSCQLTSFKLVVIVFMYFQLYKSQEIYKSTSVVLMSLIEEARIQIKYLQIRWADASYDYYYKY